MQESEALRGLRGWLVLIVIGLVISISRTAYSLLAVHYPLFADGTFTVLSTPGTTLYNPLWAPILVSEALINGLFVATYAYLIYLFISEHYLFPKVYIATVIASAVFIPLDAWVCSLVFVDEPHFRLQHDKRAGTDIDYLVHLGALHAGIQTGKGNVCHA